MLQQHSLKHIVKMFGILIPNQTKFAILFLSLILTACGGTSERTTPPEEPVTDGVAPSLTIKTNEDGTPFMRDVFAKATNKCNLKQKVAIDQTVLVQVSASESVLAPNVTIAGIPVAMSGTNYTWSGEFDMSQLPPGMFVHDDNIPYEISVTDSSGLTSDPFKPNASDTDALQFCDAEEDIGGCACYPEDISGVWKLAPKERAMGVGQAEGVTGDWSSTTFHLSERDCVFDDTYTFISDAADPSKKKGAFFQEMDGWTWLEPWQSGDVERCGLPQSPFDGSNSDMSYVWDREKGTLTLKGAGAHIALPRVANDEENTGTPVEQVVYNLETASDCFISFTIKSGGPSPWWRFEIAKSENLDGTACVENGDGSGVVTPAPKADSIFSTDYEGMPASDMLLSFTKIFSSDPANEIQPTTVEGTFNVPDIYFVNPDGDEEEDNPGAYAGFLGTPKHPVKLYKWEGTEAGQTYLNAAQANSAAAESFEMAEDELNEAKEQGINATAISDAQDNFDAAAILAKDAAKALRDAVYFTNNLTFGSGGYIYFKGSVPSGGVVDVQFKIDDYEIDPLSGEFADDENGEPSLIEGFTTDVITVKGLETGFYGVAIDSTAIEGNQIAMLINTPDTDVVITDIRVITTASLNAKVRGPYFFNNVFSNGIPNPVGDDPATTDVVETDALLGTDGKLLGEDNKWPEIEITDGVTFMVPSVYFEDPDADGDIDNPGAYSGIGVQEDQKYDLEARPLTFGEGGKVTFMASVKSGSADVRFRFEKIATEVLLDQEPSCTIGLLTPISGSTLREYTMNIPVQANRTFKHALLYIDTPDTEVTITDIKIETSPRDPTATPIDCGSDAATYGDKELDMTAPYGDATIDTVTDNQGESLTVFRVTSESAFTTNGEASKHDGFGGYAIKRPLENAAANDPANRTILEIAPAAFGAGGKITFTASIPVLQQIPGTDADGNPITVDLANAQTSVDVKFRLERLGDEDNRSCLTEPAYDTKVVTILGPEKEYTIDIPEQGFNTFESFIMTIETLDTQVQISNIILTTTPPTEGVFVFPDNCLEAKRMPSEYFKSPITATDFDGDGISDDEDPDTDGDGTPDVVIEDDPLTPEFEQSDDYNYTIGVGGYTAIFSGVFGKTTSGTSDTLQSGDQFTFPSNSADYGGWANGNTSLNLQFASPSRYGTPRIAFCASAPLPTGNENIQDVNVLFKFENEAWPNNSEQVLTTSAVLPRDGEMRAYLVELTDWTNVSETKVDDSVDPYSQFKILLMYIDQRDVEVTIGKVYGNWNNGADTEFWGERNFVTRFDRDRSSPTFGQLVDIVSSDTLAYQTQQELRGANYCSDFPVADTDGDGIKDNRDLYPNDPDDGPYKAQNIDMDGDGKDDLLDGDIDGDGVINVIDASPYDLAIPNGTGDFDRDGVKDSLDAFPYDETESEDTDGDGVGKNTDSDDNDSDVQ